jgi:hypothetical protein
MANRYAEDIRRIAGVDNLAGGIGSQPAKQPIQGGRGIAYFNADGTIGSESGTKGETTPPEDAADGNAVTDGDGNTGDDITHEPVSDSGVVPVEDLFNGNMGIGDSFTGVNGLEDCSTGQEYEVRGDGQFNAPDGWEDANTPPPHPPTFQYSSLSFSLGDVAGPTASDVLSQAQALAIGTQHSGAVPGSVFEISSVYFDPSSNETSMLWSGEWVTVPPGASFNVGDTTGGSLGSITSHSCAMGDAYGYECVPTEWPSSTPAQITWDAESSSFITSQYDGNVASQYKSNNAGQVTLCDSSGNQFTVVPSKDGGLVFTDVTNNIFIVRDNNGKIKAAGSGSIRDQYVAK